MLSQDFHDLIDEVGFADPNSAVARFRELTQDDSEAVSLIRILEPLQYALSRTPDTGAALNHFVRFSQVYGSRWQLYRLFHQHPAALETLIRLFGTSNYLADVLVRNPEYFDFVTSSSLIELRSTEQLGTELNDVCTALKSDRSRSNAIRRFRRREILRIGIGDIREIWSCQETTRQLSNLADATIQQCLQLAHAGTSDSDLFVLALGKLGGQELNYSSDIDLIFVCPSSAQLARATRVSMQLTRTLSDFTEEGFLYRVDLRLRPFGKSGALVASSSMMERYLGEDAHPAERQALVKARCVAGNKQAAADLFERIRPLITRDAEQCATQIRTLKDRIERQHHAELKSNVKIGPGGIRDIEFIVQALQIKASVQDESMLSGNTLIGMERLEQAELLPADHGRTLRDAYIFLREIEHRLQLLDNQQKHNLPEDPDQLVHLARGAGFGGVDQFIEAISLQTGRVRELFERYLPETGGS